jgi:hypothetical protein
MKQLTWFCLMTVPLTLSLNVLEATFAHANPSGPPAPAAAAPSPQLLPATRPAPRPGIWQEMSTIVDGVTIRKIRDTTGGDYNVCYVASRQEEISPYKLDTYPAMLSISCVPEKRP